MLPRLDVGEGNVDVGITGVDVVEEALVDVNRVMVSNSKYSLHVEMTLSGQKQAKRHNFIDILVSLEKNF